MRISSSIWLGFGIIFATFGLLLGYLHIRSQRASTTLQHLEIHLIPANDLALEVRNDFQTFRRNCEDSILFGEPAALDRAEKKVAEIDLLFKKLIDNPRLDDDFLKSIVSLQKDIDAHALKSQLTYRRMLVGGTDTASSASALATESEHLSTRIDTQYSTLRSTMRVLIQDRIQQSRQDGMVRLTMLVSLILICGTGLFFLLQNINNRLGRLVRASSQLQAGDYQSPIQADERDELGQFASAFECMRLAIDQRSRQLESMNLELDGLVQRRTALLEERNQQLTTVIANLQRAEAATALVQAALAQTGDGVLLLHAQERFTLPADFLNRGCLTALGLPEGFDLSLPAAQLLPNGETPAELESATKAAADGKFQHLIITLHRTDQNELICEWMLHPIRNQNGDIRHVLALVRDITERRLADAEREQGRKLESVGQLAAGIAHEINTPIQFIGDNLDFIGDAVRDLTKAHLALAPIATAQESTELAQKTKEIRELLAEIDVEYLLTELPSAITQSREGVGRVAEIVKALKEFSHPGQGSFKEVDINRAIRTTTTIARSEFKYVADLVLDLPDSLPPVPCNSGEINQVILNLVINAAHAIEDVVKNTSNKGMIRIATRTVENKVEITFEDSGGGIPEHIQERIFDPFFTTKTVGRGTGQGLYLARKFIVKHHHGTIDFHSNHGIGTIFTITLPLSRPGDLHPSE